MAILPADGGPPTDRGGFELMSGQFDAGEVGGDFREAGADLVAGFRGHLEHGHVVRFGKRRLRSALDNP